MDIHRAFVAFILVFIAGTDAGLPLAILRLQTGQKFSEVCAVYNPSYSKLPEKLSKTPKYPIYHPFPHHGCNKHTAKVIRNSSVFITQGGNCTFFDKLRYASQANAKEVVIIARHKSLGYFPLGTKEQHKQISFPVAMVSDTAWLKTVTEIGTPDFAQLYHPLDPPFDPNLAILWLIATFTVVMGALWSGVSLKKALDEYVQKGEVEDDEFNTPPFSCTMIPVFIIMACLILLALYFLYKYVIYAVIAIFAFVAVFGTYDCIYGLWNLLSCGRCKVPENKLPFLKSQPEVASIIIFVICLGLSAFWIVIRNSSHGWILQDIFGVCFCISLLKVIKLPSLKISTILLGALLLYDVFFVFITPMFIPRGKSVMVEVATGRGSTEQLPMVIKIPKFVKTAMSLCERPYSLIGLGDILLPGIFVSFCHNFDVVAGVKYKVYFITSSIAYAFGLIITFMALVLMKFGQPALLYLAPSVLLACFVVGLIRGELRELWTGEIELNKRREYSESPLLNPDDEDDFGKEEEEEDEEKKKFID